MEDLESQLRLLCLAATQLIRPTQHLRRRWVRNGDGAMIAEVNDPLRAHRDAVVVARPEICGLDEYVDFERTLQRNQAFSAAAIRFGYENVPWQITENILLWAVVERDGDWLLDAEKAVDVLRHYDRQLTAEEVVCTCSARVHRLELGQDEVAVADDLSLVVLDESELDTEVGLPELMGIRPVTLPFDGTQGVQVRGKIGMRMSECGNFFNATHRAREHFTAKFADVLTALRLLKLGSIELGSIFCTAPLYFGGQMIDPPKARVYGRPMRIEASDGMGLRQSYRRVADIRSNDRPLDRAVSRFVSSRERPEVYDRVIDLVIAWESVLLTVAKNSPKSETSYRFSINGASVLHAAGCLSDKLSAYQFMRTAYDIRSTIVHGADDAGVEKEVKKSGYASSNELANFLDESFRRAVVWLTSISASERPYAAKDGWERLLFGCSAKDRPT
jgi:hypothetical protein